MSQSSSQAEGRRFLKLTWRRLLLILVVLVVIAGAGFVVWANTTNPLMPEADVALQDSESVTVSEDDFIAFVPQGTQPEAGLIFYPGGRVQAAAYAPLARAIAEEGYFSAIVYAPLNLAFFGIEEASTVIDAYPEITHWAVGGHSLGGVAASLFADGHPDEVEGLLLLASYPANSNLAQRDDLAVVSVYGTNDGLAGTDRVLESAADLPSDARFVEIEGGNHAQFGYYGDQSGDNPASISREEQQARTVEAAVGLLQTISETP